MHKGGDSDEAEQRSHIAGLCEVVFFRNVDIPLYGVITGFSHACGECSRSGKHLNKDRL
jgi:hypothetical protein